MTQLPLLPWVLLPSEDPALAKEKPDPLEAPERPNENGFFSSPSLDVEPDKPKEKGFFSSPSLEVEPEEPKEKDFFSSVFAAEESVLPNENPGVELEVENLNPPSEK